MSDTRVIIQHWSDIVEVVTEFRDTVRSKMETAESNEEMWRNQGAVRALNMVLNLPNVIAALKGEQDV